MNNEAAWTDAEILRLRPAKNPVDPQRPYSYLIETEPSADGRLEDVATIFLTNRECPYRCLMCDLWKNTTDDVVAPGQIPAQIDFALRRLPPAQHVKLYNSGNFFDVNAIPRQDRAAIADRVRNFDSVIVENHPRLCTQDCVRFRDLLGTRLTIALGLETVHARVLPLLNKRMTVQDFDAAVDLLTGAEIVVRAFVLLRPPGLSEEEGVEWAVRSMAHAFSRGVECCSVIPTRGGNGAMERLSALGRFIPPSLTSLERTLEAGLALGAGRVFADLWDVERLADCRRCGPPRLDRLRRMNLAQTVLPRIDCRCGA